MIAKRVKLRLSGEIGETSVFYCGEKSNMSKNSVSLNMNNPFFTCFTPTHSKYSRFTVFMCFSYVLRVFFLCRISEIFYPVIQWIAINVVNVIFRPNTVNVEPCKPMRKVFIAIYSNPHSSISSNKSGDGAFCNKATWANFPSKLSSLRAIMQNFAQSFGGNVCRIFRSHDAPPVRWDQRRGRVDSACLASSLYHVKNALLRLEAIEIEGK